MSDFDYHRPASVKEAVSLLAEGGEGTLPVVGATDVWVNIHSGSMKPKALVSLAQIPELSDIRMEWGALSLGACVTHGRVEDSDAGPAGPV